MLGIWEFSELFNLQMTLMLYIFRELVSFRDFFVVCTVIC